MNCPTNRLDSRRDRPSGGAQHLASAPIKAFDELSDASDVGWVDRPTSPGGADAFTQGAVACTDDRKTGNKSFRHDMTERLRIGTREQHDVNARSVQKVGEHLVVEQPVRLEPRRGSVLELAEVMDLDRRIGEVIGEIIGDPESLLCPSATNEGDSERLVEEQALVDLATRPVNVDQRAVRDDLDARRVDVVDTQEVIGGTLAREHPSVDRLETRRCCCSKVREVRDRQVPSFGQTPFTQAEILGDPAGLGVPVEKRVVRARQVQVADRADDRARKICKYRERRE